MKAHPLALAGLLTTLTAVLAAPAAADRPNKLTVAIYAPSIELSSGGRLALVQDVARNLEQKTGIPTAGKAFTNYRDLVAARPDFAILDPLCIAAHTPGKVLATATIGGDATRRWGLYAHDKVSVKELAGQKVAYVDTQCRDTDFIDHAVFLGQLRSTEHFSGKVTPPDIASAVVAMRDLKKAAAVIAPAALAGSLQLVIAVEAVPNPGFVVMNKNLDGSIVEDAEASLRGTSSAPIDGWARAAGYGGLASRMSTSKRALVLAPPDRAIVSEPEVIRLTPAKVRVSSARRMLWEPPASRRSPAK